MDKFEEYLNKKDNEYVDLALIDKSYKSYIKKGVKKNEPNYKDVNSFDKDNLDLSTLGDAIIKFVYVNLFIDDNKIKMLSKEIEKYITDKYFITKVAKKYDILKHLKYDKSDSNMHTDYEYKDNENRKFIATAVEAMIGAIYLNLINKDGDWFKEISSILKEWMTFE
ncbi:MAG: ribonuclease III domain-containing protein [Bacilli bacterium]